MNVYNSARIKPTLQMRTLRFGHWLKNHIWLLESGPTYCYSQDSTTKYEEWNVYIQVIDILQSMHKLRTRVHSRLIFFVNPL